MDSRRFTLSLDLFREEEGDGGWTVDWSLSEHILGRAVGRVLCSGSRNAPDPGQALWNAQFEARESILDLGLFDGSGDFPSLRVRVSTKPPTD
jgi:hypothetical protein